MKYEDFRSQDQLGYSSQDSPSLTADSTPNLQEYLQTVPMEMNLDRLQKNLGHCLDMIDDEVMKGYVGKLNQLPIIPLDISIDESMSEIHFFRISELVYQEEEFSVDKFAMVFHALTNHPCTLVLLLKSNEHKTEFYFGVRPNGNNSAGTLFQMLSQSMLGFFPGSRISKYYDEDMKRDMDSLEVGSISSVTCIADYRQNEDTVSDKKFIQGLEKFIDTMKGKVYTAFFIADNVDRQELKQRKQEYERIYTQISPFAHMQMSFTTSDSGSTSVGSSEGTATGTSSTRSEGTSISYTDTNSKTTGLSRTIGKTQTDSTTHTESKSTADGRTHTKGKSEGISKTTTKGMNTGVGVNVPIIKAGMNAGLHHSVSQGISHTNSISDSVSKTLTYGLSNSQGQSYSGSKTYGTNESDSISKSIGSSTSKNIADTSSESFSLFNTKTVTDTFGTTKGITLNIQNMTLRSTLQKIEKHLKRIEECESYGMWNFAAYFLGETAAETETAASIYKAVIAGTDSDIERSAINTWTQEEQVKKLEKYIKKFLHPQFSYEGFSYQADRYISVDPSALVSTNELAIHMGLPRHSVKGLPVVEHVQFAQEVITREIPEGDGIDLGNIYNLGKKTNTRLNLDLDSLAMHTFITGSTGSGKSNTVYKLLDELRKKEISFLVIEPAKGEYKSIFGRYHDVTVFGTNPNLTDICMLKINPFRFPKHIHILEHLDRLIEIFNVCWSMYAAMPAILKDSVERAYRKCGWDLQRSVNQYDNSIFPTFSDVVREIREVLNESDYSAENKGDYTGSLVTRLRSLTNGINGLIFTANDLNDVELFDKNAIVDLSRIGSSETKSLIMGLLILKLQEYRMEQRSNSMNANEKLKHITVLEEAHNLLRRTSTEQAADSANMMGKSVEMLANSIAEMRTYGEGFVIADQSPGLLDMSVIRNTNTKIILRLPDFSDRELVGKAAGLNDGQIIELAKLEKGVAAISQNNWIEPVLCKIDKYSIPDFHLLVQQQSQESSFEIDKQIIRSLLAFVMDEGNCGKKEFLLNLKQGLLRSGVDTSIKCSYIKYLNSESSIQMWRSFVYDFLNAGKAINESQECTDIYAWVHSVVPKLEPSITEYPSKKIDFVLGCIIWEQAVRDESYKDIFCAFTEAYQNKGGVY